jgi:hypothetical protein
MGERGDTPQRITEFFKGENKRQRLGLPMLDIKVCWKSFRKGFRIR